MIPADEIASASFESKRKGLDPEEVRSYLARVAETVRELTRQRDALEGELTAATDALSARPAETGERAPVELDEETLTEHLGQHAARVLAEARSAAADRISEAEAEAEEIRAAAEELHAQRSVEADREAQRIRDEAATLKGESEALAEAAAAEIVAQAEADADETRRRSSMSREEADAEADRIIREAELTRRQILEDLARRRSAARRQIEQLRAGRERLLSSHETVRRALDEITEELSISMSEARAAAETAGHTVSDTTIEELEAEIETARLSGLLDTGPVPVVERTPDEDDTPKRSKALPTARPVAKPNKPVPVKPVDVVASSTTAEEGDVETSTGVDTSAEAAKETAATGASDEATEPNNVVSLDRARNDVDTGGHPAAGLKTADPSDADDEKGDKNRDGEAQVKAAPVLEAVKNPVVESVPMEDAAETDQDSVGDLFAELRTRAESKPEKAAKKDPQKASPSKTKKGGSAKAKKSGSKKPSAAARKRAEAAIDTAEVGRRLKRVLADEQSRTMSTLKSAQASPSVPELLEESESHVGSYWSAIESHLGAHADDEGMKKPVERLVDDVRRRVGDALDAAGEDPSAAVEPLRSIYREVKTRSIEGCVDDLVETAARNA